MAKPASPNISNMRPNYTQHARIAHLYQAATLLTTPTSTTPNPALARIYLNSLRGMAKKAVIRLDPSIKRSICKRCDSLLIPGVSATHEVENKSKNGRKPWADVLVVGCKACGALKRYPVGAEMLKEERGKKYRLWSEGEDGSQAVSAARKGKDSKGGNGGQQSQEKNVVPPAEVGVPVKPGSEEAKPVVVVTGTEETAPLLEGASIN